MRCNSLLFMRCTFFLIALILLRIGNIEAQTTDTPPIPKIPDLSPLSFVRQDFSTTNITLEYSRPSMRGRKIFGDFLPYGTLWRMGANATTKITFAEDVIIGGKGGKKIPAGAYALYAIPKEKEWVIIFNQGYTNWGLSGYHEKEDVLRVSVPSESVALAQETLSLYFDKITKTSCVLCVKWENTLVEIPISVENEQRIDKIVKGLEEQAKLPYLILARYYLQQGKNLETALQYIDKALASNPKAFFMLAVKAEILYKLGKKEEARTLAAQFLEGAKGTPYESEYEFRYRMLMQ